MDVLKRDALATFLLQALVVTSTLYVITYEPLPSGRTALGGLTTALTLALVYICVIAPPHRGAPTAALITTLLILTGLLASSGQTQDWEALLRYIVALSGIFAVVAAPVGDARTLVALGAATVIGAACAISLSSGFEIYAGTLRLAPFMANLHGSAITIAGAAIVIWVAPWRFRSKAIWGGVAFALVGAYSVVTAALMLALFIAGWFVESRGWKRIYLYVAGAILIAAGLIFRNENSIAGNTVDDLGADALGSGRLSAWSERIGEFFQRDVPTMLSGGGPYSDYQITEIWWWAAKNAHSDVITILMEFGLIGLTLFALTVVFSYRRAGPYGQLVVVAIVFGMASSNTLLDRPSAALMWGFALYAASVYTYEVRGRQPRNLRTMSGRRERTRFHASVHDLRTDEQYVAYAKQK